MLCLCPILGIAFQAWLRFPLRNSSFPRFPFLLDPISRIPFPARQRGSMIQSIFLVFLLLRKHDSDLNNVEHFWIFLNIFEEKKNIVDSTAKWSTKCASAFECLDWMRLPDLAVRQCHGVCESAWKIKSSASFSFSFDFPQVLCSFWHFQKER